MKRYYVYLTPEKGEAYSFVTGVRRLWLLWKKAEYSYVPTAARVNDYRELDELRSIAAKETGRNVTVTEVDGMDDVHGWNVFFAVREPEKVERWYTGKWYADTRLQAGETNEIIGERRSCGGRVAETSGDIRECQLFVRHYYAEETRVMLNQKGFAAMVQPVYVNVENVFARPSIVTLCVNKLTCAVRYLKSYKRGDHRLRYTDSLDDAMLIYPEQMDDVYEYLSSNHKDLSFTMIVRPKANLAASEVKKHEAELIQRMTVDYYIGKK